MKFVVVDDTSVYWTTGASTSGASGTVAKVAKSGGVVRSVSVDGGAVTDIRASTQPSAVAANDGIVYFTDLAESRVHSVPMAGGTATLLADGEAMPWRIAVGGGQVVWSSAGMYDYQGMVKSIAIP